MNKVWVVLAVFVALAITGIVLDNHYDEFNKQSVELLKEADKLAADKQYEQAGKKAGEFIALWDEHKSIYSWVAKQLTLSPITSSAEMLIPLLQEENYSEFRSNCQVIILYIEYLYEQEHLNWKGVL